MEAVVIGDQVLEAAGEHGTVVRAVSSRERTTIRARPGRVMRVPRLGPALIGREDEVARALDALVNSLRPGAASAQAKVASNYRCSEFSALTVRADAQGSVREATEDNNSASARPGRTS